MNIPAKYRMLLPGADQALTSFANLLSSMVVLKTAGVSWFGTYSFIMVICVLIHNSAASILHGQMMLRISASKTIVQTRFFRATFIIFTLAFVCFSFVLAALFFLFSDQLMAFRWELLFALIFVYFLGLYELFKRYLYVVDGQIESFICTLIYVVVLMVGLVLVYFYSNEANTVAAVFGLFAVSYLMAALANKRCIKVLLNTRSPSLHQTRILIHGFFKHGKFAFLGQLVTTIQNQGITLFLMFVAGATVVGYFSLARLLTVPVVVFNMGLTNGFAPKIRVKFKQAGLAIANAYLTNIARVSMLFSLLFFAVLALSHHYNFLVMLFPEYPEASKFLLIWSFVTLLTIYRGWKTQLFVVSMEFYFLLRSGVIALLVTVAAALILYYSTHNFYTVAIAVLVGELTLLTILSRKIVSNLAEEHSSS